MNSVQKSLKSIFESLKSIDLGKFRGKNCDFVEELKCVKD